MVNTPSNSTLDQVTRSTQEVNRTVMEIPEAAFTFQITFPTGGFWGVGLKPWDERKRKVLADPARGQRSGWRPSRASRPSPVLPPALPGGGTFPVEVVLASTAETPEILGFARQLQEKAAQSGMFAFPPLIDVKLDQPQSEIVLDRDKVAALGLSPPGGGAGPGARRWAATSSTASRWPGAATRSSPSCCAPTG